MHSHRSDSLSQPPTREAPRRPQAIVLLEDHDLYSYHQQQQQRDHQQHAADVAISVPHTYNAVGHLRHPSSRTNSSFPASELDSERGTRHFQLHATPYHHKASVSSMGTVPLAHGALRPGGPVDLFSRQYIGLLFNWALVGFFNGSVSAITYPLLAFFLGYSDPQLNASMALFRFPWLLKFLAGFLTDCFPINRQRRKPYIYIGWTVFMLFMAAMSFMGAPSPQRRHGIVVDEDAASQGAWYVIPTMFGTFGHLLATVAVEGLMVEFAQREGEFERGRTQALCLIARFSGEGLGALSVALALNSPEYGGDFAYAVPLQAVCAAQAVIAAVGIVVTKCWLHEERTSTSSQRLATQLRRIWSILQQRTTWQITAFGFIAKVATYYRIQESRKVYTVWLGAKMIVLNVADSIDSVGSIIAAAFFMGFLLNANWRKLLVATVAVGLAVMVPIDVVTVFDVWRSLPLYLAKSQAVAVADAFVYILRTVVIVEVAEPGYEAVTFGVITTVSNLVSTVVPMVKNIVATTFTASTTDLALDTAAVRGHIMDEFVFKYGLRVAMVLLVLPLLPHQKRHLKEIRGRGNPTLVVPVVLFVVFAALFVVSVTSNLLALFESTSCLVFAGGKGCH